MLAFPRLANGGYDIVEGDVAYIDGLDIKGGG